MQNCPQTPIFRDFIGGALSIANGIGTDQVTLVARGFSRRAFLTPALTVHSIDLRCAVYGKGRHFLQRQEPVD